MKHNISKELFETVMNKYNHFGTEYPRILDTIIDSTILYYSKFEGNSEIQINDFFFMCKEWAFSKGYKQMLSGIRDNKIGYCWSDRFNHHYYYEAPTEQQAVFDACQWILDKNKQ